MTFTHFCLLLTPPSLVFDDCYTLLPTFDTSKSCFWRQLHTVTPRLNDRCVQKILHEPYEPTSPSKNAYHLAENLGSECRVSKERIHFVFCKWANSLLFAKHRLPTQECIPLQFFVLEFWFYAMRPQQTTWPILLSPLPHGDLGSIHTHFNLL